MALWKQLALLIILAACCYQVNANENATDEGHEERNGTGEGHEGEEEHEEPEGIAVARWRFEYVHQPLIITVFIIVVSICKLGFHHANLLSSILPESCLLIILGTILGAIINYTDAKNFFSTTLSPELFFLYLLPPIILEAAYSLHDRVFFDNLGTILVYAIIGTLLNCFILGPILYGLAEGGAMGTISISLIQCLVFSALIVAVDPVAVLAIFQEVGVNNVLYFLVFGESLLNDAVTVVLYNTMTELEEFEGSIPARQIFLGVASFFTVSLGGLSIGILMGFATAIMTKHTSKVRVLEPLALFSLAYGAYILAELFEFSGIISTIGCGLVQAQYAFHNISVKSLTTVNYVSKMLSGTSDAIIFMFLGLALVRNTHVWHSGFILWSLFLCLVIRFGVVYFLTFLANKFWRSRKVDWEEQFIMAYGGLRGAVAFSLVEMLDEEPVGPDAEPGAVNEKRLFLTATLAVIIFTVFIQGISIKPFVSLLRIKLEAESAVSIYQEINDHVTDHVLAGVEEIAGHRGRNLIREKMDRFDNNYLKRWLQKDPQTKDDKILDLFHEISLQLHYEAVASAKDFDRYADGPKLYKPDLLQRLTMARFDEESALSMVMASNQDKPEKPEDASSSRARGNWSTVRARLGSKRLHGAGDAESGPRYRRKSRVSSIFMLPSPDDDQYKEDPSVEDVRKWMVQTPKMSNFHKKYDRNLKHSEDSDLVHHLQEKQRRHFRHLRQSMRQSSIPTSPLPSISEGADTHDRDERHGGVAPRPSPRQRTPEPPAKEDDIALQVINGHGHQHENHDSPI